jgi:drug/metabolite transporter (DMT)-like permease
MSFNLKNLTVKRDTVLASALLLFCGALWGAMPMLSKLAEGSQSHPIGLSLLVNAMGAVVCAVMCWWRGVLRRPTRAEWHFFLCWSILYAVFNQVLVYWLSARLEAAVVSVFTVLEGLVIFVAAAFLRLEKPEPMRCCGLLLGLSGVIFLFVTMQFGKAALPSLAMVVGLAIPLCYAAESLFIAARKPMTMHPMFAVAMVMACSVPLLLALALAFDDVMPVQFPPGRREILAVVIMVATLLANLGFFMLIHVAGPVFAGQLSYFNAICGIGWGVLVLGEKLPWGMYAAVACILLGLLMVRPKMAAPQEEQLPTGQPWPAE